MQITNWRDYQTILRQKKQLQLEMAQNQQVTPVRIAILTGSTTAILKDLLTVHLLARGINPIFYESGYNRYYEEAIYENNAWRDFKPDIVYIHTCQRNLLFRPNATVEEEQINPNIVTECERFQQMWQAIASNSNCAIIQNNFELPLLTVAGNFDSLDRCGAINYVLQVNSRLGQLLRIDSRIYLQDINYLAAIVGLHEWYDEKLWYAYKIAVSYKGLAAIAHNLTKMIVANCGRNKKCVVVDVDNTLWGGVIGDDGLEGIKIGAATAEGEAYRDFQLYLKNLQRRGILLAISSKNDLNNIQCGFAHPDMVLTMNDFVVVEANWEPKIVALQKIANKLNIGLDSLLFIDDNPAEREIVQKYLPQVVVPDIGNDVSQYCRLVEQGGWFELLHSTTEDLQRSHYYQQEVQRRELATCFVDYSEYLNSLQMIATVQTFTSINAERIAQLFNKTNQFNLTGKRYNVREIEQLVEDTDAITLTICLRDKFGDNGLVAAIIAKANNLGSVNIENWAMSCRVFKRGLEQTMWREFCSACAVRAVHTIYCPYQVLAKNKMVRIALIELGLKSVDDYGRGNVELFEFVVNQQDDFAKEQQIKIIRG